ncbi:MAG TPA: hypothetical protein VFH69_01800 [Gemmatimonadota bacterium]|nr:hypothetical protein [Gemmatimonadota bacterium]
MLRATFPLLLAVLMSATACMNAERASDDEDGYDVVVEEAPRDSGAAPDSSWDVADGDETLGSPPTVEAPPTFGSPPTLGAPPPQEFPQEQAVGWVSVTASDGSPYEVLQDGNSRGVSAVRLTQRPGNGEYVVRNDRGEIMCRSRVDVRQYESVCLECDVRTGKFHRENC